MIDQNKFAQLFGIPEFVIPHLALFFSEKDMELVLALDGKKCSIHQVADQLHLDLKKTQELLEDSRFRYVVTRAEEKGETVYFARNFFEKLFDYNCLLESFQQIDPQVRRSLADWCYGHFIGIRQPFIAKILNRESTGDYILKRFLLPEDLAPFLDACHTIELIPCNCRSLAGNCAKPRATCLRFNGSKNDRPYLSKRINRAEAKEMIQQAHQIGLMQTVNGDWRTKGPEWMCNCDACCCWPTRFGKDLGLKAILNQDHHVARHDPNLCIACGKCLTRCNFQAFFHDGSEIVVKGKNRKKVLLDAKKCWGCGICTTTCPTHAITLEATDFYPLPNG
jgi:NAD-dependent dihydropyrimidine dehydrogenase PreA subunit